MKFCGVDGGGGGGAPSDAACFKNNDDVRKIRKQLHHRIRDNFQSFFPID